MCARWENFVVHLRTSRALSEPFLSSWQYSVLLALTRWIHLRKCSYAYRNVNLRGTGDLLLRICARWENFVVHLRTSRALSEPFLSSWQYSVNSALTRWIPLRKCSYAYRTIHWDVNLHWSSWSLSAHKVNFTCGTFSALFKQMTILC